MRDPYEKENINKKIRRYVCVTGVSMVKAIISPGIFKIDHIQVKAQPDTTTGDIIK